MKITIPSKLSEIKIKDYQKYIGIYEELSKTVDKDKDKNPIFSVEQLNFLNIKLVEILCHIKINDINAINVTDFEDILKTITNTFKLETKLVRHFTIKGVEYGFIPDLEHISMGEYVDLSNYITNIDTVHKALAVMYRPSTKYKNDLYTIEEYESSDKYKDVMKEAGLDIYLGAQVFFYSLGIQLAKHTLLSLSKTEENSELKRILDENGDGLQAFTRLLTGGLMNLTVSQN